eukprot:3885521-Pyramimonas_sp.AAC.3
MCKNLALLGHYALAVKYRGGVLPLSAMLKFSSPLRTYMRHADSSITLSNSGGIRPALLIVLSDFGGKDDDECML